MSNSKAKEVKAAYERTFSTEDGKKVLLDLMSVTGLMAPSLDLGNPSPLVMAYNDGAKSLLHRIIHQVNLKPDQYLKLLEEKTTEEMDYELD